MCGLRSQIFRQIVQILCSQPDGLQVKFVRNDGNRCKQGVRRELCGARLNDYSILSFICLSAEILSAENQAEKAGNRTEKIFKENDETRSYSYGNISAFSIGKLNCDCGFAESV